MNSLGFFLGGNVYCRILNSPTVLLILTYYRCDKVVSFLDIAPCSSVAKNLSICSSAGRIKSTSCWLLNLQRSQCRFYRPCEIHAKVKNSKSGILICMAPEWLLVGHQNPQIFSVTILLKETHRVSKSR